MLEVLILAALGVWLALALRSCLRRRGKGCGGCDGCCDRCGGAPRRLSPVGVRLMCPAAPCRPAG